MRIFAILFSLLLIAPANAQRMLAPTEIASLANILAPNGKTCSSLGAPTVLLMRTNTDNGRWQIFENDAWLDVDPNVYIPSLGATEPAVVWLSGTTIICFRPPYTRHPFGWKPKSPQ